ncbi:hypothetical protein ARMGADRAFT_1084978 [Armillaria gallica]|uniref:Uncharacterized protein n=1 Tax=Armillaria gallica TaxID=47427 RepID=A0A2H3CY76_ARMGA|nr:hypothetical protein ARMGADRAFT_1084978 [Armillaria gallica]
MSKVSRIPSIHLKLSSVPPYARSSDVDAPSPSVDPADATEDHIRMLSLWFSTTSISNRSESVLTRTPLAHIDSRMLLPSFKEQRTLANRLRSSALPSHVPPSTEVHHLMPTNASSLVSDSPRRILRVMQNLVDTIKRRERK